MKLDRSLGVGSKIEKLTIVAIAYIEKDKWGSNRIFYECLCDCGKKRIYSRKVIQMGHAIACGCTRGISNVKHGATRIKILGKREHLYTIWRAMKQRCYYQKSISFENYGYRGISVCDEWRDNYPAFKEWSISNGYKKGLSIDRINNDGNYSPDNCRWATRDDQSRNTRNNVTVEAFGEKKLLKDWFGDSRVPVRPPSFYQRLNRGFSIHQALFSKRTDPGARNHV